MTLQINSCLYVLIISYSIIQRLLSRDLNYEACELEYVLVFKSSVVFSNLDLLFYSFAHCLF